MPRSNAKILQEIVNSIQDGVTITDKEGNFVAFNEAAKRILAMHARVARRTLSKGAG